MGALEGEGRIERDAPPSHPYDPLEFLEDFRLSPQRLAALVYWYQYTEFAILPALHRFVGISDLFAQLSSLSTSRASAVSADMRAAATWRAAAAVARCAEVVRGVMQY